MKNKKHFNKEAYIQSIIIGKTKSSLRISFIIFLSFLILFSTIVITAIGEYSRIQKDYYDNHNTHIIEIDSKSKVSFYEQLNFNDVDSIKNLLGESCHIWCEHKINFGTVDNSDNNYFIYSYSQDMFDEMNLKFESENVCYSSKKELNNKTITLRIPVINVNSSNFESFDNIQLSLHCRFISPSDITAVNSVINNTDNLIVSEKTYYEIINYMFDLDQQELTQRINNENNLGVSPVNRILVYCDDINEINDFANKIIKSKYNTDYVLDYFDNITESIEVSKISIAIVLVVLLIVTSVNLLASFELYFKNLQKDFGILKHYGYKDRTIFRLYINKFFKWFLLVEILLLVYNFVLSYITVQYKLFAYYILISAVELIFVITLFLVIQLMLWKKCKKTTIALLKFSKEFE